ncbi:hypothetical protein D3C87_1274370 [compost metagenome]
MSRATACEFTGPTLPARSTTRVCTVQSPAWLWSSWALHWVPLTKAVFQVWPPSVDTCKVSPAASDAPRRPVMRRPALPSLVAWSSAFMPLSLPMPETEGVCVGARVSTSKCQPLLASPVWPTGPVAVAVMWCAPSLRLSLGVNAQVPSAPVWVLPRKVVPSWNDTVWPGWAVPCRVGRASLVTSPGASMWGTPTSS